MRPPIQRDLVGDYAIRQGATYTLGMRIKADGALIDTAALDARMKVRAPDWDGEVVVDASTGNGRIILGWTPPEVERSTAYIAGQMVTAGGGLDGYIYLCTTGGTTDGSPVIFTDTLGATTNDGTVVWTCEYLDDGSSDEHYRVVNLYILLPADYTAGLTAWGRGVWDLELVDGSTVMRLYEGLAYLSPEATKD